MHDVTQANIRAGGATIDTDPYNVTIAQDLLSGSATGGLTKIGDGNLILSGTNTYEGGTMVQGGTLSAESDANLGAVTGSLTLDGGMLRITGNTFSEMNRAVIVSAAESGIDVEDAQNTVTLNGVVSGSGALLKDGDGSLRLTGPIRLQGIKCAREPSLATRHHWRGRWKTPAS
jgi:fibronectin-binding autotransporter adhesin